MHLSTLQSTFHHAVVQLSKNRHKFEKDEWWDTFWAYFTNFWCSSPSYIETWNIVDTDKQYLNLQNRTNNALKRYDRIMNNKSASVNVLVNVNEMRTFLLDTAIQQRNGKWTNSFINRLYYRYVSDTIVDLSHKLSYLRWIRWTYYWCNVRTSLSYIIGLFVVIINISVIKGLTAMIVYNKE